MQQLVYLTHSQLVLGSHHYRQLAVLTNSNNFRLSVLLATATHQLVKFLLNCLRIPVNLTRFRAKVVVNRRLAKH